MAYYLVKGRYTGKSWKAFVSRPVDREAELKASAKAFGIELHRLFFAFGQHDVVAIMEAPDNETLFAFLMTAGASEGVESVQTTVLMTAAEAKDAMQKAKSAPKAYGPPSMDEAVEKVLSSTKYYRP